MVTRFFTARRVRRLVATLLILSTLLTSAYVALSLYIATQLVYAPQKPIYATPAAFGMQYRTVTFPSREDHLLLRGWFIPGLLSNGQLTSQRTIIMVHGNRTNRADKVAGLLKLSVAFAQHGFAVLAFDMRGTGESPPAPLSLGATTLLLAAAKEPAIRAVVSDCGYPEFVSILEREIPKGGHLPALFTPGAPLATQALYGIDFYAVRPVDIVA